MPSSTIRDHRYDPETRTLSIWFVSSGRRYDYYEVPPEVYEAFTRALSKGRWFNQNIRDRYRSEWMAWEHSEPPAVPEPKAGGNVVPFVRPAGRKG